MDVTEQMQFADGLFARNLYELARDEYLKLSRLPEGVERLDMVLYRIGECYRRLDNPAVAERFYLRVLTEFPSSDYALRAEFRRAEIFVTQGRYLDSINLFRALLAKELPTDLAASARYYKGYSAKRLQIVAEAEADYRAVMKDYPSSPFADYAALDLADLIKSDPERAREALALYQGVLDKTGTPKVLAEALFQSAEWNFRAGDFAKSAALYDRLLREYPKQPRASEGALQAAWAYHNAGRYADGLALAARAVEDASFAEHRADWLYVLANCQRQLLRADEARATYGRLLEEYPKHELVPVASYEKALIAFRQNEFEQAVKDAQAILPGKTVQQDLYWLLAESYAALGREDEAVQNYRLLLEHYPDSDQAPKALYRLGRLLQQRKDYPAAQRAYHDLVSQYPKDEFAPASLLASAFCAAMDEQFDEALSDWDTLIKDYPAHALAEEALFQKGLTQMQMGREKPARTTFDAFLKKYAESRFAAEAHYWRGILMEQEDRQVDAEKSLRAALTANPEVALAERIRYRLAMNLQRQGKDDEAADLIEGLLDTPAQKNMPPSLLEWLVAHRLELGQNEQAVAVARRMTERADTPAWKQIAWSLYGRALMRTDATKKAVAALERSLKEDAHTREGAEAGLFLGDLKLEAGKYEEAAAHFERAAEAAASDDLMDVRAKSYFGMGQVAAAREDWAEAIRYFLSVGILFDDPTLTPESLYRAVDALEKAGRTEESARTREELKQRYPESEWTAKREPDEVKEGE